MQLLEMAIACTYDVLIVATHDTDLEPALDSALRLGNCKIETTGWAGAKRIRPAGQRIWHTFLDGTDFVQVRDRRNYW
jgi:hypothetical protein